MDDNEIAKKLEMYLKILPNQDAKIFGSYSVREIYENVKNGTPEGKKFIEMSRSTIEGMIEGWKNILQD